MSEEPIEVDRSKRILSLPGSEFEDLSDYVGNYSRITTLDGVKRLADLLLTAGKPIGFDVETGYTGQDKDKASLDVYYPHQFVVGFSITNTPAGRNYSWARYIPLLHDFGDNLDPEQVWPIMKPVLEELDLVAHNWVFEARNLRALEWKGHGPQINLDWRKGHDSMIQSYVLSETQGHALKDLTLVRYNYDQTHIDTLFEKPLTQKQVEQIRFNPLGITPEVVNYVCDDVTWALRLDYDQRPKILQEGTKPGQLGFIYEVEREIMGILVDMADVGIAVDWAGIQTDTARFDHFYQQMENRTRKMFEEATGQDLTVLNFRSHVQMRKLLFEDMGLTPAQMTKPNKDGKQSASTSETSLEALRHQHPAIDQLLKYRQTKKMGEWFQQWSARRTSYDDRVHPSFNQIRVQSGRFASDSPNVQNITKKWWFSLVPRDLEKFPASKEGDKAYEAFVKETGVNGIDYWSGNARDFLIASPGYTILSFDYSQQELRVLAGLSKEPYLIESFEKGIDIHKATAALMFNTTPEEVTDVQRQKGKAQPLDAKVLTPTGYRLMGELEVGDLVIGSDGFPTKITGVFPQGPKKVYRVETTDGSTECCDEHLWTVRNATNPSRSHWVTKTLKDLIAGGLLAKGGTHQPKWMLPERPVVQFDPQAELPIDPYILGLLLGDGGFTHSWAPSYGSADAKLLQAVCDLGLDNVKCENKFVPDQYLTATPAERLALLQGLLDTDGNVLASGVQFSSASENLARSVQFLVRSLGGSAALTCFAPKRVSLPQGGKFTSRLSQWRVTLRLPAGMVPFRLRRKVEKLSPVKYGFNLRLKSVTEVGEKECQCISVENEDGLYITDNEIVTHNTINFGNVYGQGAKALGDQLGISEAEAQELFDKYFSAFSRVSAWFAQVKNEGKRNGYVRSFLGRKSTIWELRSPSRAVQSKAERLFVNVPVQGGGADISKLAMIRSKRALVARGWWGTKVRLLMNQHDSLVFEVSDDLDLAEVKDLLTPQVSFPVGGFPKFEVDWEFGSRWGSCTKWEDRPEDTPDISVDLPNNVVPFPVRSRPVPEDLIVSFSSPPARQDLVRVRDLLKSHPGERRVRIQLGGQEVVSPFTVDASPSLLADLSLVCTGVLAEVRVG